MRLFRPLLFLVFLLILISLGVAYFLLRSQKISAGNGQAGVNISLGAQEKINGFFEKYSQNLEAVGILRLAIRTSEDEQPNRIIFTSKSSGVNKYIYSYSFQKNEDTLEIVINFDVNVIQEEQLESKFLENEVELAVLKSTIGITEPELSAAENYSKAREAITELEGTEYSPIIKVVL